MKQTQRLGKIGETLQIWGRMAAEMQCEVTDFLTLARYKEWNKTEHFVSYLIEQSKLPPEKATLLTWVAAGDMELTEAMLLYENCRKHRRSVNTGEGTSGKAGNIFAYSGIDAASVLYDIFSEVIPKSGYHRNKVLVFDKHGHLFDRIDMGFSLEPGGLLLKSEYDEEAEDALHAVVEHSRYHPDNTVLLSTWDRTEEFEEVVSDLPHKGIHVVANVDDSSFFNIFDPKAYGLYVVWLRRAPGGQINSWRAKLSDVQKELNESVSKG